ncbi:unnamed protein product [Vitrella brassicaformis CCMP3155]|uniref:Uncharacterized protein n=1 Tax=Vitrella brassicaformis (strain CCMP3155) TaxID=1169540 RepID=A0A0G4EAJ4_VITBC|nr:unnamed protein product [Vitrella brassicaformis CCMP3155]|eukprot:CEL92269.1 unnamed protein product [Vitrella brassicaformis CCMP3155]
MAVLSSRGGEVDLIFDDGTHDETKALTSGIVRGEMSAEKASRLIDTGADAPATVTLGGGGMQGKRSLLELAFFYLVCICSECRAVLRILAGTKEGCGNKCVNHAFPCKTHGCTNARSKDGLCKRCNARLRDKKEAGRPKHHDRSTDDFFLEANRAAVVERANQALGHAARGHELKHYANIMRREMGEANPRDIKIYQKQSAAVSMAIARSKADYRAAHKEQGIKGIIQGEKKCRECGMKVCICGEDVQQARRTEKRSIECITIDDEDPPAKAPNVGKEPSICYVYRSICCKCKTTTSRPDKCCPICLEYPCTCDAE